MKKRKKFLVVTYLAAGVSYSIPVRGRALARRYATSIVAKGLRVQTGADDATLFPASRIFKVTISRGWKQKADA